MSKHIIETHEKNKKDAFIKECSEMVTKHLEYKSWEEEIAHIRGVSGFIHKRTLDFCI